MIRLLIAVGFLALVGVGFYVFSFSRSAINVAEICEEFPVGAPIYDVSEIGNRHGIKAMGPFDIKESPGTRKIIYCSVLTMCDTSCAIEFKNGQVTSSSYNDL